MNKIILAAVFILSISSLNAQHTKSVELKPIHVQGGRYFYDYKKVYGGAYAIQIPLQSLEDREVDLRVRNYKTLRGLGTFVSFIPLIYFFSVANHHYVNYNTFWTVWGASVASAITFDVIATIQLRKGIDRYNILIVAPSETSLGASLIYKFGH